MKLLKDAQVKDKNIVMRVDFNVPVSQQGDILDDNRIKATLSSIKSVINAGAKRVILISHLGRPVLRPKEKIERIIEGNSHLRLLPVAKCLASWLKVKKDDFESINLAGSPLPVYQLTDKLFLMENIRFLEGEKKCDQNLTKKLASLGDIFVFDAFAVAHHPSCSVSEIPKHLPSFAGLLVDKEVNQLEKLMINTPKPFVMILGGAKIEDKILVMKNLLKKVDFFLLGGVMANTFLASRNVDLKQSVVENDRVDVAVELMEKAAKKIILPVDLVWDRGKVVDIGKTTCGQYARYIEKAEMIFINGTMGLTSMGMDKFALGTQEIIKLITNNKKTIKVVSGGDTVAEVNKLNLAGKFTFVSTGGGATLEFLAGNKLPGLEALN